MSFCFTCSHSNRETELELLKQLTNLLICVSSFKYWLDGPVCLFITVLGILVSKLFVIYFTVNLDSEVTNIGDCLDDI